MKYLSLLVLVLSVSFCLSGRQEKCPNGCKKGVGDEEAVSKIVANLPPSMQELADHHNNDYKDIQNDDNTKKQLGKKEVDDESDDNSDEISESNDVDEKRQEGTTRRHRGTLKHKFSRTEAPVMKSFRKRISQDENQLIRDSSKARYIENLLQSRYVLDKRDVEETQKVKSHPKVEHFKKQPDSDFETKNHIPKLPEGQDKHAEISKKEKLMRNMKVLMEGVKRNLDDYSHLKKKK